MDDISDPVHPDSPSETGQARKASAEPVKWKDPRFQPAIDSVRAACGFAMTDREDDPIIGM